MKYANNFKQQVKDLYESGTTLPKIAKILSVSKSTVSNWLRKSEPILPITCNNCSEEFINVTPGCRRLCYKCKPTDDKPIVDLENKIKKCSMCNEWKSFDNFVPLSGRFQAHCKQCNLNYKSKNSASIKKECVEYKGGKCERCKQTYHHCCYDFHHLDPSQKEFSISKRKNYKFTDTIKNELDKCILVCSNCHRMIHEEERQNNKN